MPSKEKNFKAIYGPKIQLGTKKYPLEDIYLGQDIKSETDDKSYIHYNKDEKRWKFKNGTDSDIDYPVVGSLNKQTEPDENDKGKDNDLRFVYGNVEKTKFLIPTTNDYRYTGETITAEWFDYYPDYMSKSGDLTATQPGIYAVIFHLLDSKYNQWEDGTSEDKTVNWYVYDPQGLFLAIPSQKDKLTFNGSEQSMENNWKDYDPSKVSIITEESTLKGTNAGTYSVKFSIINKSVFKWIDGTTEDKIVNWVIDRANLTDYPIQSNQLEYQYDPENPTEGIEQFPTWSNAEEDKVTIVGGILSSKNAGTYTTQFKPTDNYCWLDDSTNAKNFNWLMDYAKLNKETDLPVQVNAPEWTGEVLYPQWSNQSLIDRALDMSGTTSAIDIGIYTAKFTPKTNYVWSDTFLKTTEDVNWRIKSKYEFDFPVYNESAERLVYSGEAMEPARTSSVWINYDSSKMTITCEKHVDVGTYSCTFTLADGCTWSDGSIDPHDSYWKIYPKQINIVPSTIDYEYTGSEIYPTWYNYKSSELSKVDLESEHILVNEYHTTFTPTFNYEWYDGTVDAKQVNWNITKKKLTIPTLVQSQFDYDGTYKNVVVNNLDTTYMDITGGTTYAKDVGEYYVEVSLKDEVKSNVCWSDGTTDPVTLNWYINGNKLTKPTLDNYSFIYYPGNVYTVNLINFNSNLMNLDSGSVLSASNPGTYPVTVSLKDTISYIWSDGTTDPVILNWEVKLESSFLTVNLNKSYSQSSAVVVVTDGSQTLTESDVDTSCNFMITTDGTYAVTATETYEEYEYTGEGTIEINGTNLYTIDIELTRIEPIYGVTWDGTNSSIWSRTDSSSTFVDPNPYYGNMTDAPSSPFDNISPWKDIRIVDDASYGQMVEIPKFYYSWTKSSDSQTLKISAKSFENSLVSPAHMDRGDGKGERDVIYVGRFHSDSTYLPKVNNIPLTNITRSEARNYATSLGTDVYLMDYATWKTIQMLYLVEFGNWNSQLRIGYGCSSSGAIMNNGYTETMTQQYHTGTTATTRTTYGGTQYRYIEGLWDNVLDWIDGCYIKDGHLYIINNPTLYSDDQNGTDAGEWLAETETNKVQKKWSFPDIASISYASHPSELAESVATNEYICDMVDNGSGNCLCVGGAFDNSQSYGLFYIQVPTDNQKVGFRIIKI